MNNVWLGVVNWLIAQVDFTQTEVDFGSGIYQKAKSFTITDSRVSASSQIIVQQSLDAPTGKSQDENEMDTLVCKASAGSGQFSLYVESLFGSVAGKFKLNYSVG